MLLPKNMFGQLNMENFIETLVSQAKGLAHFSVNGQEVHYEHLQISLAKFVRPFIGDNNDPDYPIKFFGTCFTIKFRNLCFAISTKHQRKKN